MSSSTESSAAKTTQEQIQDLENRVSAIANGVTNANREIEDLQEEVSTLSDRLEAVESRLDVLEDASPKGKDAKVAALVEYAEGAKGPNQQGVALKAKEIKGTCSCTRRYAYDLMDELPQEYHFISERDKNGRRLLIDFEALHSDPEAVNKFTTRASGEGA